MTTARNRNTRKASDESEALEPDQLPPRRVKHPPEYIGITRKFQTSLLIMFFLLLFGMIGWYFLYLREV